MSRSYQPGRSVCFFVRRPKLREVFAADFADRIVHHVLFELLERTRTAFALQLDVRNYYFTSIDKYAGHPARRDRRLSAHATVQQGVGAA